ncbi:MAG: hypothetical protein RXR20_01025 [Paraburkholderia sp.]|jgi:hypothetical protein|uniref:hypothetical protein n=1 Tax=Burkholderiaceae TaxID=119060 RepID=UPI0010F5BFC2|nr:hypothetical protein [Burkholderia sp. 4M9327F10]
MQVQPDECTDPELPAGLIVFAANGSAQFGWRNPETGEFYSESDGSCIRHVVGAVEWHADRMH